MKSLLIESLVGRISDLQAQNSEKRLHLNCDQIMYTTIDVAQQKPVLPRCDAFLWETMGKPLYISLSTQSKGRFDATPRQQESGRRAIDAAGTVSWWLKEAEVVTWISQARKDNPVVRTHILALQNA